MPIWRSHSRSSASVGIFRETGIFLLKKVNGWNGQFFLSYYKSFSCVRNCTKTGKRPGRDPSMWRYLFVGSSPSRHFGGRMILARCKANLCLTKLWSKFRDNFPDLPCATLTDAASPVACGAGLRSLKARPAGRVFPQSNQLSCHWTAIALKQGSRSREGCLAHLIGGEVDGR